MLFWYQHWIEIFCRSVHTGTAFLTPRHISSPTPRLNKLNVHISFSTQQIIFTKRNRSTWVPIALYRLDMHIKSICIRYNKNWAWKLPGLVFLQSDSNIIPDVVVFYPISTQQNTLYDYCPLRSPFYISLRESIRWLSRIRCQHQ